MIEFDYNLDYKNLLFEKNDKRYRIGRGEQGVLLVRPYTNDICKHWRFKTPTEAYVSASRILFLYNTYRDMKDFVGMDMARKFLEMGFTRARRYANHKDGKKDLVHKKDKKIYKKIKDLAHISLIPGVNLLDITDGATHYHADYVQPAWRKSKTKTVEIGDHIFYRWEK